MSTDHHFSYNCLISTGNRRWSFLLDILLLPAIYSTHPKASSYHFGTGSEALRPKGRGFPVRYFPFMLCPFLPAGRQGPLPQGRGLWGTCRSIMAGKSELKKSKSGQFMFNLRAGNNQVILTSELYREKAGSQRVWGEVPGC